MNFILAESTVPVAGLGLRLDHVYAGVTPDKKLKKAHEGTRGVNPKLPYVRFRGISDEISVLNS